MAWKEQSTLQNQSMLYRIYSNSLTKSNFAFKLRKVHSF